MSFNLAEFLPLMLVFILAVISPGPDFVLILRQALQHGRRCALLSSAGIGAAMLVHVSYTILGLGLIIAQSLLLFNIVKWAGVAYLFYLGFKAIGQQGVGAASPSSPASLQQSRQHLWKSFLAGFAINLLNPKAVLFFLSIFSTFVAPTTPMEIKFSYGIILASTTMAWFVLVSIFMTSPMTRQAFARLSKWIVPASGIAFIGLGIRLIFQQSA